MPWVQRPRPGIPSYATNFAGPDRLPPANPNLWDGLIYNWHGPLGVTGIGADDVKDTSGNHNHGTPTNMVASSWVMTEKGYALDFAGVDDQVKIPDDALPLGTVARTVMAWVSANNTNELGVLRYGNISFSGGRLDLNIDNNQLRVRVTGGTVALGAGLSSGWHLVGITCEANITLGDVIFYADGISLGTGISAQAIDVQIDNTDAIGTSASGFFNGLIASVAVWNRALTPNEIQTLFVDTHAITRPMQRLFVGGGAAAPVGNPWYYYAQQAALTG